jgi:hypothetical protein
MIIIMASLLMAAVAVMVVRMRMRIADDGCGGDGGKDEEDC